MLLLSNLFLSLFDELIFLQSLFFLLPAWRQFFACYPAVLLYPVAQLNLPILAFYGLSHLHFPKPDHLSRDYHISSWLVYIFVGQKIYRPFAKRPYSSVKDCIRYSLCFF